RGASAAVATSATARIPASLCIVLFIVPPWGEALRCHGRKNLGGGGIIGSPARVTRRNGSFGWRADRLLTTHSVLPQARQVFVRAAALLQASPRRAGRLQPTCHGARSPRAREADRMEGPPGAALRRTPAVRRRRRRAIASRDRVRRRTACALRRPAWN